MICALLNHESLACQLYSRDMDFAVEVPHRLTLGALALPKMDTPPDDKVV